MEGREALWVKAERWMNKGRAMLEWIDGLMKAEEGKRDEVAHFDECTTSTIFGMIYASVGRTATRCGTFLSVRIVIT